MTYSIWSIWSPIERLYSARVCGSGAPYCSVTAATAAWPASSLTPSASVTNTHDVHRLAGVGRPVRRSS